MAVLKNFTRGGKQVMGSFGRVAVGGSFSMFLQQGGGCVFVSANGGVPYQFRCLPILFAARK